jgi:hypothetical protein
LGHPADKKGETPIASDSDYPRAACGSNLFDTDTKLIWLLERRSPHVLEAYERRLSELGGWPVVKCSD